MKIMEDSQLDNTNKRHKRKSRKQLLDESILKKYHQSRQHENLNEDDNVDNAELNEPLMVSNDDTPTIQEHDEANQVLDEVNVIRKIKNKSLSKSKKKFKLEQLKQQQEVENKETKKEKALLYLRQWKKCRDEWKFKKNMHIWLLKNWKHTNRISDKKFKTFLKYLKTIETKSSAIERLENECKLIVNDQSDTNNSNERARNILQWIS